MQLSRLDSHSGARSRKNTIPSAGIGEITGVNPTACKLWVKIARRSDYFSKSASTLRENHRSSTHRNLFTINWCQRPGLNRRPKAYESSALTTELLWRKPNGDGAGSCGKIQAKIRTAGPVSIGTIGTHPSSGRLRSRLPLPTIPKADHRRQRNETLGSGSFDAAATSSPQFAPSNSPSSRRLTGLLM